MAYRFETGESVQESFERCSAEELDRAVAELTERLHEDPVDAIHEARKALKMERALLRLCRAALKRSDRRRQNAAIREVARRLSGARDADVMVEALDGLASRYTGQLPQTTFAALRERLHGDRNGTQARLAATAEVQAAVDELRAIRGDISSWRLRREGWKAVEEGLERSYERGRAAFAQSRREPTMENLHEWRKRVKDLWYHLRLLEDSAPLSLKGQVEEAHRLADLLGDDHDLAVLRDTLRAIGGEVPVDHDAVIALLEHRREQLQEDAWFVGERVYAEKPRAFVRRLRRYWKAAEAQARSAAERDARQPGELTAHASVG